MLKRVFLLASVALVLTGCIGIPLRMAKRMQKQSNATQETPAKSTTAPPVQDVVQPPAALRAELDAIVQQGAPGVTAIVMKGDRLLYRLDVGQIAPETEYEVASASKWLTTALVMTVVDEGKLSLDAPISRYVSAFKGEAAKTTLRELLAQTSGQGSLESLVDVRQDPRITLAQSAALIAARPLENPPGAVFKYGGPSFQVAGAMVEAVTHRKWSDLFAERLATPLGMTHTYWTHLPDHGVPAAAVTNPLLQGGAVTTAEDYMRFLTMIDQHGLYQGKRILSEKAVDDMETAQTIGKPMAYLPPGVVGGVQYALGNWCEEWIARGHCTLVSSPGAFGAFPWIDRESNVYGIFFLKDRSQQILPHLLMARRLVLAGSTADAR